MWSTNTPFEPTADGYTKGYTRFHAYAVLNFNGDLSAAARSLKGWPRWLPTSETFRLTRMLTSRSR